MGFVGFEEVEMTKTEESLTDLDQVIIKDSFYARILVLVDSPEILAHRKLYASIVRKFWFDDNFTENVDSSNKSMCGLFSL